MKNKTTTIRLDEQLIKDYETLGSCKNLPSQTLMKTVLQEYLNLNYARIIQEHNTLTDARKNNSMHGCTPPIQPTDESPFIRDH